MTPQQFKQARRELGLTLNDLAIILGLTGDKPDRTIRRWEGAPELPSSRPPNPIACRVLQWMLDGYRPPEFPAMLCSVSGKQSLADAIKNAKEGDIIRIDDKGVI